MNKLSLILKNYREEKNLSLRELAEHLGISHTYLSKLEKGFDPKTHKEIAPTIDILLKIAKGLSYEPRRFLEECGYIKGISESNEEYINKTPKDIKKMIDEIISIILDSDNMTYNGKPIEQESTKIIAEALEIALEISLKNLKRENKK